MARTVVKISVSVRPEVYEIIKRRAAKEHRSESSYVQACVVMDALAGGDVQAAKLVGFELKELVRERLGVVPQLSLENVPA